MTDLSPLDNPGYAPALVVAPTWALYKFWAVQQPEPRLFQYVDNYERIAGGWNKIIVLNGGSFDPHIMALVNHPSRAGIVTKITV